MNDGASPRDDRGACAMCGTPTAGTHAVPGRRGEQVHVACYPAWLKKAGLPRQLRREKTG